QVELLLDRHAPERGGHGTDRLEQQHPVSAEEREGQQVTGSQLLARDEEGQAVREGQKKEVERPDAQHPAKVEGGYTDGAPRAALAQPQLRDRVGAQQGEEAHAEAARLAQAAQGVGQRVRQTVVVALGTEEKRVGEVNGQKSEETEPVQLRPIE